MKKKIKKYLFTRPEADRLVKMLASSDRECKKLALAFILNSKTYKHYGYNWRLNRGLNPGFSFVTKYSH